ncbi:cryptochrome/photolyase family protein [Aliivibrio fischeri]|uniref:cryptochrome/photolyase family protein n=1 Tax=Aliivibrio fischeri TaxID=668 RepID=UPI0012DA1259|nr:cryptochrome/photolyase family protein [Aliivibrio fischeri]MUJ29081.1 cryptochrome/photolyase family protein [Aliivibrio fischeri]
MNSTADRLRLILGDQLNASHSWFQHTDPQTIYVIAEMHQETAYVKHHVQKVCTFFAAMTQFATALESAGHRVMYLTLDDTKPFERIDDLLNHLIAEHHITHFEYQLPDEYRLRSTLERYCLSLSISSQVYESEHFFLAETQIEKEFKPNHHHRMEPFYRKMRKRFNILMKEGEPIAGKWNFDSANQNKLKPSEFDCVPTPLLFANDVTDILKRLERHNVSMIGQANNQLLWPVNRQQANELLMFFCRYCLPLFGKFQDAMTCKLDDMLTQKQWSLFHSRLSFALNAKILSPMQVIDAAITEFNQRPDAIDIAQIEGFVRQILGWREFVRGIYWRNMPDYQNLNKLEASLSLPSWFWTGKTKMNCMHYAIQQSLDFAYAHHIQRLMITGNFCLLTGIKPDEVDEWYLGIYIDAIEWVEMPNTRGMSQFADGGIVASKAYAASGNYVNKMSDYCSDCHYNVKQIIEPKACPLNALYWHFMHRHIDAFNNNPRTRMVYANWKKKSGEQQQVILERAKLLLLNIEEL